MRTHAGARDGLVGSILSKQSVKNGGDLDEKTQNASGLMLTLIKEISEDTLKKAL